MGLAIITPNIDFSGHGLGKVTRKSGEIALTALTISGASSLTGSGSYSVAYIPTDTTQTGVTWSIVSGADYASISAAGVVTAKTGASASSVTIKATSTANSSISATKTISVTASASTKPVTALAISGASSVTNSGTYSVTYTPTDTTQTGVTWSIVSGSGYASISSAGVVTAKAGATAASVTIKATSTANSSVTATKTISVTSTASKTTYTLDDITDAMITQYNSNRGAVKILTTRTGETDANWTAFGTFATSYNAAPYLCGDGSKYASFPTGASIRIGVKSGADLKVAIYIGSEGYGTTSNTNARFDSSWITAGKEVEISSLTADGLNAFKTTYSQGTINNYNPQHLRITFTSADGNSLPSAETLLDGLTFEIALPS